MDLLLILTYTAICIAIFKLFKIPLNKWSVPTAILGGIFLIGGLMLLMNYNHPYTKLAQDYFVSTPIVPSVRGQVIEVNARPNTPLKKGDVLFKIDPEPFQAKVQQKQAALAEAEQQVKELQAAMNAAKYRLQQAEAERDHAKITYIRYRDGQQKGAAFTDQEVDKSHKSYLAHQAAYEAAASDLRKAKLAYEANINGENTTVAKCRAELKDAQYDLEKTVVTAPTDGYITQLALRPGMMAVPMPLRPVMVFIHHEEHVLAAAFQQNSLQRLQPGYSAEVIFPALPGKVFQAEVANIIPVMAEGQFQPSGLLQDTMRFQNNGRALAQIKVTNDLSGYHLPGGVHAEVAVYSDHLHHVAIIRKILLRVSSWLNYIFVEGH